MTHQDSLVRTSGVPAQFIVHRSGWRPLQFEGRLLARSMMIRPDKRQHHLRLFQTDAGKFVASVEYESGWKGEHPYFSARVADTLDEATRWFETLQPSLWVRGYPNVEAYAKKQRRLLTDITHQLGVQVSLMLASVPEANEIVA